jgi:hypothetical protein
MKQFLVDNPPEDAEAPKYKIKNVESNGFCNLLAVI